MVLVAASISVKCMNTIKLSSEGQVCIPEQVRTAHQWEAGQELEVVEMAGGILLRPKMAFSQTDINDVAGCLAYKGKAKTLDEMDEAIAAGVKDKFQ